MYQRSMTGSIRRSAPLVHYTALAVLLVVLFVLSLAFSGLRFPGSGVAPWWPAAGVAVIAAVAARGRRILISIVILVVSGGANLLTGSDPAVAIGFGAANAVEALVIASLVADRGPRNSTIGPGAVGRLLGAIAIGGIAAGVLAALTVVLFEGGDGLTAFMSTTASHASAVLLIAPFALVPRTSFTPASWGELTIQLAALAVTIGYAFAPGQTLPLSFLPFPVLAWAAFRFGTGLVLLEVAATAAAAATLAFLGGGPFATTNVAEPTISVGLLQTFTLAIGVSMLLLSGMQNERAALITRLGARERLLRGGIVSGHAGFLLAEEDELGRLHVIEANPVAEDLFAPWIVELKPGQRILRPGPLAPGIAFLALRGWSEEVELADARRAEVTLQRITGPESPTGVVVVQAVDVTERRRVENALTAALENERISTDRLRELNRQKDDFVSSVSHELRTPVTSILGYAEELADEELSKLAHDYVTVIARNARRLAALVEDLLVISRVASSAPVIRPTPVDLGALLTDAIDEVAPLARTRGVTLEWQAPTEPLHLSSEPEYVTRIVINLLSNGIKFTPDGGRVVLTAEPQPDHDRIELRVADSGRGIPPEELDKVFERFYRSSSSGADAVPGTGLGLPIVRTLAEQLGGRVWLTSDGEHGTTAIAQLPLTVRHDVDRLPA
jgi:two-component system phosphate regulon sensor histidine kinase PhoR